MFWKARKKKQRRKKKEKESLPGNQAAARASPFARLGPAHGPGAGPTARWPPPPFFLRLMSGPRPFSLCRSGPACQSPLPASFFSSARSRAGLDTGHGKKSRFGRDLIFPIPIKAINLAPHLFSLPKRFFQALAAVWLQTGSRRRPHSSPVATRASRSLSARPKTLGEFAGCSFFPCPQLGFWCTESWEWLTPASSKAAAMAPPRQRAAPAGRRPLPVPRAISSRPSRDLRPRKEHTPSGRIFIKSPWVFPKLNPRSKAPSQVYAFWIQKRIPRSVSSKYVFSKLQFCH